MRKLSLRYADKEKERKEGSYGYSDWQIFKFMLSYLLPYKKEQVKILAYVISFSWVTALGPIIILEIVDRFTAGLRGESVLLFELQFTEDIFNSITGVVQNILPFSTLVTELIILTAVYTLLQALILVISYKQITLSADIGLKAVTEMRNEAFEHLQYLDLSYHDKNEVGRTMSRVTSDVEAIREMLAGQIVANFANVLTVLVVFVVIFILNPVLASVSLALMVLVLILSIITRRYNRERSKKTRSANAIMMANVAEAIGGIKVIKGHNREDKNKERFEELNREYRDVSISANSVNAIFFPLLLFLNVLGIISIIVLGTFLVNRSTISAGVVVAFLAYNAILFRPVVILGNFYQLFQDAVTGAERVKALLETPTKIQINEGGKKEEQIGGEVVFDHVDFEYLKGTPVLADFSLEVPQGETLAIVGRTGAGKTSVINLLSRMYAYQSGEIEVDQIPIEDFNLNSYKKHLITIPQDFFVFSTSVRENLRLGKADATSEEMWQALDVVGLKQFVERMSGQLDAHLLENGSRLSLGQRQLLILASVFLANPRIFALDEATSSIDIFSEVKIQRSIELLLTDRTSFVIAHRLSTIRDADRIIVIDDGKIIEDGKHEELLDLKGHYYDLVKSQVQLSAR